MKTSIDNVDVANALLKSSAFNSLSIETEVFEIVRRCFPRISMSPYFTDVDTGKLREIDVIAEARYTKNKKNTIYCNLHFFIECKSNKGFNVIANGPDLSFESYLHDCTIWTGYDVNKRFEKSRKILANTSLTRVQIDESIEVLNNLFYPNGTSRPRNVQTKIFCDIPCYASFRETNIKDEKDIDNSVLWRAFQSLVSAQTSLSIHIWQDYEESLLCYGEYKCNKRLYPADFSLEYMVGHAARTIDVVQKIVVIDSPLWKRTDNNKIEAVKYFRLLRRRIDSIHTDFVDVVNRQHFTEYMKALHDHYKKVQKEKRIARVF